MSNPGDFFRIPVFDEKDSALVTLNRLRWMLANRLFLKTAAGSREVAGLEFGQEYSFSDPLTTARPGLPASRKGCARQCCARLPLRDRQRRRARELRRRHAQAHAPLRSPVASFMRSCNSLNLTWYTGTTRSRGQRTVVPNPSLSGPGTRRRALAARGQTAYDIHRPKLLEQRLVFRWRGSCWRPLPRCATTASSRTRTATTASRSISPASAPSSMFTAVSTPCRRGRSPGAAAAGDGRALGVTSPFTGSGRSSAW